METSFIRLVSACFLLTSSFTSPHSLRIPPLLGVHPLDENYFGSEVINCRDHSKSFTRDRLNDDFCDCLDGTDEPDENYFGSEVINCRDHSKSFTRDRLNDDFCDCLDGTDEPGTSACPAGKFYCLNRGSTPRFLFSSRVNDQVCDCCDGSDEYDGSVNCPNTCIMGGNIEYKTIHSFSGVGDLGQIDRKQSKSGVNLDDLIQKLTGLKILIIIQVVITFTVVVFRILRRRTRSKRRRYP